MVVFRPRNNREGEPMSRHASPDVPGRFEHGSHVVDVEEDRSLVLWSIETGDAIAIPAAEVRGVLFLLCDAYVNTGRFATDKERKAHADALARSGA
jgi:hypothetical protein